MWIHPHVPFHDDSGPAPRVFTWCRRQKSPPFTSPATGVCSRSRIRPQGSAWIPHHSRSSVETSHKHSEKGCGVAWCSRTRSRFTSQPPRCLCWWGAGSRGTAVTPALAAGADPVQHQTPLPHAASLLPPQMPVVPVGSLVPLQVFHPSLVLAEATPAPVPCPCLFPNGSVRQGKS